MRTPRFAGLVCLALMLVACSGCVRRRMTVRSNPPGALVYVDQQPVGITPVSFSYTYYGTRTVQLIKDGYETVTEQHTIQRPWYQVPPVDFFAETLWPFEIRDERVLDFQMAPQQQDTTERILQRGEQLRFSSQQGVVPTLPPR